MLACGIEQGNRRKQDREGNLLSLEFSPNAWPTNDEVRLAWGSSSKVAYGALRQASQIHCEKVLVKKVLAFNTAEHPVTGPWWVWPYSLGVTYPIQGPTSKRREKPRENTPL